MVSKCPYCETYNPSNYLGVFCLERPYYKIFQCINPSCQKYYTIEIQKGERLTEESLTRTRDIDYFLNRRIACPLCLQFKNDMNYKGSSRKPLNTEFDFEFKYVVYIGEDKRTQKNKFYCRNHTKSPFKQNYQFVKDINKKITMGLGKYIKESSSEYFYRKVKNIYKEIVKKYDFKKDPEEIFLKLYALGIPQPSLARIFHTSQPTISRLIKKKMFNKPIHTIYIEKDHPALFYTQIKISELDLLDAKKRWKKFILNP